MWGKSLGWEAREGGHSAAFRNHILVLPRSVQCSNTSGEGAFVHVLGLWVFKRIGGDVAMNR